MNQAHQPPPWANQLGAELPTFLELVRAYFAHRNLSIALDVSHGILRLTSVAQAQGSVIGLRNLAQLCAQAPVEQWQSLVEAHFDSLLEYLISKEALQLGGALAQLRTQLRARIYSEEISNRVPDLVYRPGPEGTIEVLVLDMPTSMRTVARSEVERWGVDVATLLDIGRQNLRLYHAVERQPISIQPGVRVDIYASDPFYTASFVLLPEVWLAEPNMHGALIALPRRDTLIVHNIQDLGAMDAMEAMLRAAVDLYAEGPGSISPYVYWYHDATFTKLPYTLEGNTLKLSLPESFTELIDALEQGAVLS